VGAGRKLILIWSQRMNVGSMCEQLWRDLAGKNAREKHAKSQIARNVRVHQARAQIVPLTQRNKATGRETVNEISGDIDSLLNHLRLQSLPIRRPRNAKAKVIKQVIEKFSRAYRITITFRRVEACWKEYRAFEAGHRPEPC
jgi:hypothetical protein